MENHKNGVLVLQPDNNDEFSTDNHIFIDRVLKLSLADKTFSLEDVLNETNTVLLAVSKTQLIVILFKT